MFAIPEASDHFSPQARARLSAVLQTAKGLVTIEDVMKALEKDRSASSKVLSQWRQQGWLKRDLCPDSLGRTGDRASSQGPVDIGAGSLCPSLRRRLDRRRALGFHRATLPQQIGRYIAIHPKEKANRSGHNIPPNAYFGSNALRNQNDVARTCARRNPRQAPHDCRPTCGPFRRWRHPARRSVPPGIPA